MDHTSQMLVLALALISLQIKHFLADFPLQNKFMLRKTKPKGWLLPLTTHAGVHGALTAIVLMPLVGWACGLGFAALDFVMHFAIDLWKARFTSQNMFHKKFWVSFGLDQFAHQMTYIVIAFSAFAICGAEVMAH